MCDECHKLERELYEAHMKIDKYESRLDKERLRVHLKHYAFMDKEILDGEGRAHNIHHLFQEGRMSLGKYCEYLAEAIIEYLEAK